VFEKDAVKIEASKSFCRSRHLHLCIHEVFRRQATEGVDCRYGMMQISIVLALGALRYLQNESPMDSFSFSHRPPDHSMR
jgi:hypothetical protein